MTMSKTYHPIIVIGNACRHKIFNFFRKKFRTVDDAEKHFNIEYFDDDFPIGCECN